MTIGPPVAPEPWSATLARAAAAVTAKWLGQALPIIVDRLNAGRAYRASQFTEALRSEVDDKTFVSSIEAPEVEVLLGSAIHAAAETGLTAKRILLARVVAAAMLDDALVDESQLYVTALRELDGPHLRALARLSAVNEANSDDRRARNEALTQLWEAEPVPIRAALIRTGCTTAHIHAIRDDLMFLPRPTAVTDFGRQLLAWIKEADADSRQL
ncbi:MAG: hypothetical protein NVV70_13920 [Cellulomonas sp.]|nr:hypothetical protein [Cellulomonas sp.]MCR6649170.1 hypothetical protein [Cellulomonas sp.]